MYQVTLTHEGVVITQEMLEKNRAERMWNTFYHLGSPWNIVVLRLIVDETFNPKEEWTNTQEGH